MFFKGDKEFLPAAPGTKLPETGNLNRLKSTVANRILSLYFSLNWIRFVKRKELVAWKMYSIRHQVQKILLLGNLDERIPLLRIADDMRAEDAKLRSTRSSDAYAAVNSDGSKSASELSDDDNGRDEPEDEDMFATPIE